MEEKAQCRSRPARRSARLLRGRVSFPDNPLYSKNQRVSFGPVLRTNFVLRIRVEENSAQIQKSARTDCTHLLRRIHEWNSVPTRSRHLFQVVPIRPNPPALVNVASGSRIEVNGLPGLCGPRS